MKFLCYILSFCLLSFSTIPCFDVDNLLSDQVEEQLSTFEEGQDSCDHEEEGEEDCTASCQCCHFHSILLTSYSAPSVAQPATAGKAMLNPLFFSKNHFSIWHPPKA